MASFHSMSCVSAIHCWDTSFHILKKLFLTSVLYRFIYVLMQVLCMYQHASAMTEKPVQKKEKIVSD
jgi:hypothetical protein